METSNFLAVQPLQIVEHGREFSQAVVPISKRHTPTAVIASARHDERHNINEKIVRDFEGGQSRHREAQSPGDFLYRNARPALDDDEIARVFLV